MEGGGEVPTLSFLSFLANTSSKFHVVKPVSILTKKAFESQYPFLHPAGSWQQRKLGKI